MRMVECTDVLGFVWEGGLVFELSNPRLGLYRKSCHLRTKSSDEERVQAVCPLSCLFHCFYDDSTKSALISREVVDSGPDDCPKAARPGTKHSICSTSIVIASSVIAVTSIVSCFTSCILFCCLPTVAPSWPSTQFAKTLFDRPTTQLLTSSPSSFQRNLVSAATVCN